MAKSDVRVSERSRELLEMFARTIVPSEGPDRPGAQEMNLVDRLLEWLSGIPGAPRAFTAYCRLWNFCPLLTGRLARLSSLSLEERTRVLEKFESSSIYGVRMGFMGIKAVFMASFYNSPEVWPFIGYDEGCLSEPPHAIPK